MRWEENVALTWGGGAYRVLVGDRREGDHLEDLLVDGRVLLKWIFKKWEEEAWAGLFWLRIGTGGVCL